MQEQEAGLPKNYDDAIRNAKGSIGILNEYRTPQKAGQASSSPVIFYALYSCAFFAVVMGFLYWKYKHS